MSDVVWSCVWEPPVSIPRPPRREGKWSFGWLGGCWWPDADQLNLHFVSPSLSTYQSYSPESRLWPEKGMEGRRWWRDCKEKAPQCWVATLGPALLYLEETPDEMSQQERVEQSPWGWATEAIWRLGNCWRRGRIGIGRIGREDPGGERSQLRLTWGGRYLKYTGCFFSLGLP